jgi:hypothetical protein
LVSPCRVTTSLKERSKDWQLVSENGLSFMRRFLIEQRKVELPALNQSFLRRVRPASGQWQDLLEKEIYIWKRLAYHLREAGEKEELRDLLSTFLFWSPS